jgi:hypothetical protein
LTVRDDKKWSRTPRSTVAPHGPFSRTDTPTRSLLVALIQDAGSGARSPHGAVVGRPQSAVISHSSGGGRTYSSFSRELTVLAVVWSGGSEANEAWPGVGRAIPDALRLLSSGRAGSFDRHQPFQLLEPVQDHRDVDRSARSFVRWMRECHATADSVESSLYIM